MDVVIGFLIIVLLVCVVAGLFFYGFTWALNMDRGWHRRWGCEKCGYNSKYRMDFDPVCPGCGTKDRPVDQIVKAGWRPGHWIVKEQDDE